MFDARLESVMSLNHRRRAVLFSSYTAVPVGNSVLSLFYTVGVALVVKQFLLATRGTPFDYFEND